MGKFHRWLGEELSLYVRHLAWLMAVPKVEKQAVAAKVEPVSRLRQLEADGQTPDMPPNPAPHLVEYLLEVGPMVPAGMGSSAIGWRDISAWRQEVGIYLAPWEARMLRQLSRDYVGEYLEAGNIDRAPPYTPFEMNDDRRASVSTKISAIFGARART